MTVIDDARDVVATMVCPAWCGAHKFGEVEADGSRSVTHIRRVGELGVQVELTVGAVGPAVYVPALDRDPLYASPGFAAQLGADLVEAAGLVEVVSA